MSVVNSISSQTLDPNALKNVMERSGKTDAQKADQVGVQFEAVLIRQFLGDALKPMVKGALSEDGPGSDTYQYFLTDMLSQSLAQKGTFGVGKQMAGELKKRDAAVHAVISDKKKMGDDSVATVKQAAIVQNLPRTNRVAGGQKVAVGQQIHGIKCAAGAVDPLLGGRDSAQAESRGGVQVGTQAAKYKL